MKKNIYTLFCLAAVLFGSQRATADEGMWTLSNLPQAVYEKMQEEGYRLPYGQLYADSNAIVKAVVNFGGYC